jgi:hypothetical protein
VRTRTTTDAEVEGDVYESVWCGHVLFNSQPGEYYERGDHTEMNEATAKRLSLHQKLASPQTKFHSRNRPPR